MVRLVVFIVLAILSIKVEAQIFIDETFTDWSGSYLKADAPGNNVSGNIDIQKLWITDDENYLYFRIDLDKEIKLQETNKLGIQLDIDNNINTGFKTNGIGAEISIYFGDRDIFLNVGNTNQIITHEKIGLVALPSVSSSKFEFRLKKQNTINGVNVIMANTIALVAVDRITNGDKIPGTNSGLIYQMTKSFTGQSKPYSFNKTNPKYLRVMSYNQELDGLFDPVRGPLQKKIIKAANPDVLCLQEMYDHTIQEVIAIMNATLPLPNNKSWQGFKTNPDEITLTKFKAEAYESLNGNNISLLTVDVAGSQPLVIFNNHLPCCEKDDERQNEIDAMLKRHRDMKANGGNTFNYPKNTPTIILGDMNMVGLNQQQKSLLTGDIYNEAVYGPDYKMDWDNTSMEDAKPFVPNSPNTYTWFSEGNGYLPGRLDYMLYTGSVMTLKNSFVLETATLDAATLQANNLSASDSHDAADHLPLISDFNFGPDDLSALIKVKKTIKCNGETATVSISASNGLAPYMYAINGGQYQSDSTFANLIGNEQYVFIVKDSNGKLLTLDTYTVPTIAKLTTVSSSMDNLVTLNITGGTVPYFYTLNGNDFIAFSGSFILDQNKKYTITIKDSNGCLDTTNVTIFIDKDDDGFNTDDDCNDFSSMVSPAAIEIIGNGIDDDCKNGEVTFLTAYTVPANTIKCYGDKDLLTIIAKGGIRPYLYSIDGINFIQDSVFIIGAGIYSPKVSDASGQLFDAGLITIKEPNKLEVSVIVSSNLASFNVSGGTSPFSMSLDSTSFIPLGTIPVEQNKIYLVWIKDSNGCILKVSFISVDTSTDEIEKNTYKIYPNPGLGIFNIDPIESIDKIELFNNMGQLIYRSKINLQSVDIRNFPDGIFTLKIYTKYNKLEVHRVIKK